MSDREIQRKLFNQDCERLTNDEALLQQLKAIYTGDTMRNPSEIREDIRESRTTEAKDIPSSGGLQNESEGEIETKTLTVSLIEKSEKKIYSSASTSSSQSMIGVDLLESTIPVNVQLDKLLINLCQKLSESYRKYPLLCKRGDRFEIHSNDVTPGSTIERHTYLYDTVCLSEEKENVSKDVVHQEKNSGLNIDLVSKVSLMSIDEIEDQEEVDEEIVESMEVDLDCKRTMAIGYNTSSNRILYALSGKLRHQGKTHASLWGKSLISGRPRGNCSEFRIANSTLIANECLDHLVLAVFDLVTGQPKERCRNCLYITKDVRCITDKLIFSEDLLNKEYRALTPQLKQNKNKFKMRQKSKNKQNRKKKHK